MSSHWQSSARWRARARIVVTYWRRLPCIPELRVIPAKKSGHETSSACRSSSYLDGNTARGQRCNFDLLKRQYSHYFAPGDFCGKFGVSRPIDVVGILGRLGNQRPGISNHRNSSGYKLCGSLVGLSASACVVDFAKPILDCSDWRVRTGTSRERFAGVDPSRPVSDHAAVVFPPGTCYRRRRTSTVISLPVFDPAFACYHDRDRHISRRQSKRRMGER